MTRQEIAKRLDELGQTEYRLRQLKNPSRILLGQIEIERRRLNAETPSPQTRQQSAQRPFIQAADAQDESR